MNPARCMALRTYITQIRHIPITPVYNNEGFFFLLKKMFLINKKIGYKTKNMDKTSPKQKIYLVQAGTIKM